MKGLAVAHASEPNASDVLLALVSYSSVEQ